VLKTQRRELVRLTIIQVDAFTNKPFAGNPAAVCVTDAPLEEGLMRAIAAEMNLSETAFLHPGPTQSSYSLRWFTPTTEVDLCGHATLASAHVLWSEGHISAETTATFHTQSGELSAEQKANGWIELNFPAQPVHEIQPTPQLVKSLGCDDILTVAESSTNYLVEVSSESVLLTMTPDFIEMKKLSLQGVIVTAAAERTGYDFVSRYFAPKVGINEDPVTGSAHTSLAPYWQAKLGKSDMLAQQVSARGGILRVQCTLEGSNTTAAAEKNRIKISGQAVTVLKGELFVPY
jgi:PhzF family phenazine biosynthesis protein